MTPPPPNDGSAPGFHGVYPAIVTDIVDRDHLGRVEVSLPWLGEDGSQVRAWATLCSPYADNNQGLLVLPEVGSQVIVAFLAGDPTSPFILGAAWNGREALPEEPAAANNIRVLQSRAGSRLEFDDTAGASKVRITMASGHRVEMDDAAQTVTVAHAGGCTVTLTATGVEINANLEVRVKAPMVTVDAATSSFSGMVRATTFVATSGVISPSYTPGAGNVW